MADSSAVVVVGVLLDSTGQIVGTIKSKHALSFNALRSIFEVKFIGGRPPPELSSLGTAVREQAVAYGTVPHSSESEHLPADEPPARYERLPPGAGSADIRSGTDGAQGQRRREAFLDLDVWHGPSPASTARPSASLFPGPGAPPSFSPPRTFSGPAPAGRARASRSRSRGTPPAADLPGWRGIALQLDKHNPDEEAVVACVEQLGIGSPLELVSHYSVYRVARVLRACAQKNGRIKNHCAWVLSALRHAWDVDEG